MPFCLKNSKFSIRVFNAEQKSLESNIMNFVETLPLKPDKWTRQVVSQLDKLRMGNENIDHFITDTS